MQQRTAIEGIEVGERDTLAKLQEILYSTVVRGPPYHLCPTNRRVSFPFNRRASRYENRSTFWSLLILIRFRITDKQFQAKTESMALRTTRRRPSSHLARVSQHSHPGTGPCMYIPRVLVRPAICHVSRFIQLLRPGLIAASRSINNMCMVR